MSTRRYGCGGRSANTAATQDHVAASLWNPSSAVTLQVYEIWVFKTVGTADNHVLYRTTARGTPGSTVTPTINSDFDRGLAPPSGALIDLAAYSVQPTLAASLPIARANLPATVGSGFIWVFSTPIRIKPGEGLAVATPVATILQASDISFIWEE